MTLDTQSLLDAQAFPESSCSFGKKILIFASSVIVL
jgi:hypothetical protein